ncbi:MAG: hypothetical protein ABI597_08410 [Gammaproteobacteria bacterium]
MKLFTLLLTSIFLLSNTVAFGGVVSINITSRLNRPIYLSAKAQPKPGETIQVSPAVLTRSAGNQLVIFDSINLNDSYFEFYLGEFPGDESCTFAYELKHGISLAECPDIHYKISADKKSLLIS